MMLPALLLALTRRLRRLPPALRRGAWLPQAAALLAACALLRASPLPAADPAARHCAPAAPALSLRPDAGALSHPGAP